MKISNIDSRYCDRVEVVPVPGGHQGRREVALVHTDSKAEGGSYRVVVGAVVGGGVEFDPRVARGTRFGPRVLRMIAEAVEPYLDPSEELGL